MGNRVPNVQIPLALSKKNKFEFNQDSVSTATFMLNQPDTYLWVVPFQDVKIKHDAFTRCMPLNLPTFGRIDCTHRAFFVKFKDIFEGWNDAYTKNQHIMPMVVGGAPVVHNYRVPYCLVSDVVKLMTSTALSTEVYAAPYDFVIKDSSQTPLTTKMYLLNSFGRYVFKVLNSLGYSVYPDINTNLVFNVLPILAYVKILAEYYYPSNWKSSNTYTKAMALLKKTTAYSTNYLQYDDSDLASLFEMCYAANGYDPDYFVSSYQYNVQDNDNGFSSADISTDVNTTSIRTNQTVSPRTLISSNSSGTISQNVLDTLQRVTQFLKINQLAGTDAFDRIYAMFGYRSDSNRAIHFGTSKYSIQIGDIQSTADTQNASGGASIGSYAGKGVGGQDNGYYEFHNQGDCGIIIVVKSITPRIGYTEGIDRHNLAVEMLDFWHPLYDSLGDQSVGKLELFAQPYGYTYALDATLKNEFGKMPRFSHYKVGHDVLCGDFKLLSRNTGMDSWYLYRKISASRLTMPVTSLDFASGSDRSQYLRIFQNNGESNTYEPFMCISNYHIESYAPMRKLWDDTCLDQLEHQDGSKSQDFEPAGAKFN